MCRVNGLSSWLAVREFEELVMSVMFGRPSDGP